MDEEEISQSELTDLIKRFELDLSNNRFDYYAQHLLAALIDHFLDHASYEKAGEAVELAMQQHPYHAAFYAKKAFIYTINEESNLALELVNRALELEPGNPEYLTQKGSIYELMGQPMKALDLFDDALENGGLINDVFVLKMFVYFNLGNYEMALSMIERIFSEPIDEDRLVMEAHFCLQLMEAFDDGIRIFKSYTDLDPFQEVVWFHLGQLYASNSLFEEAIDAFEFAIAIDEAYAEPLLERGYCLMQMELFVDASKSFEEFIELEGPDPMAYSQLGSCYLKMDRYKKARSFYREALKLDAKYVPAWLGLGQSFSFEERYNEALPLFIKANKIQPNNEYVMHDLGCAYIETDRLDEAEAILKKIIHSSPNFRPAWHSLASLLHSELRSDEALTLMLEWLKRSEDDAEAMYKIAAYYLIENDMEKTRDYLTDALMLNFEDHYTFFNESPYLMSVKWIQDIIDLYRKDNT